MGFWDGFWGSGISRKFRKILEKVEKNMKKHEKSMKKHEKHVFFHFFSLFFCKFRFRTNFRDANLQATRKQAINGLTKKRVSGGRFFHFFSRKILKIVFFFPVIFVPKQRFSESALGPWVNGLPARKISGIADEIDFRGAFKSQIPVDSKMELSVVDLERGEPYFGVPGAPTQGFQSLTEQLHRDLPCRTGPQALWDGSPPCNSSVGTALSLIQLAAQACPHIFLWTFYCLWHFCRAFKICILSGVCFLAQVFSLTDVFLVLVFFSHRCFYGWVFK